MILIFSKDHKEHEKHLRQVLGILRKNQLKAKFSKCHLWREEVRFLGHIVSSEGFTIDSAKIEAIKEWRIPKMLRR